MLSASMQTEINPLNSDEGNNPDAGDRKFLWYAVCVACFFQLSTGASVVWTSPVLLKFRDINSTENPLERIITSYEEGLITSIHSFGVALGPIFFSRTADSIGRKWFLILIAIIEFCSFIILALAKHIYMYYFARLIQGVCSGCSVTVLPLFISEIAENHNRGKLVTLNNVFLCLGNVYGYTFGSLLTLKWFTLICAVPSLLSVPLFIFSVPDSPIHLVMKGKRYQAKQALKKCRNLNDNGAEKVLSEMKDMNTEMPAAEHKLQLLRNHTFRRSMIISLGTFIFVQFSGIFAILEYLHIIFSLADIPFSENLSSIIVSVIQTFSVMLGTILIEKLGRKWLQLSSAFVVALSLFVIGIYFQLKSSKFDTQNISWLPVLAVIVFIVAYGSGLGPVCFVLMSEIFPPAFKVTAAGLSVFTTAVTSFVVVFCFPIVRDCYGIAWCFWIFGMTTLLGMIFTHFYVIETKNKSFLEIQILLEKKINYKRPNYS